MAGSARTHALMPPCTLHACICLPCAWPWPLKHQRGALASTCALAPTSLPQARAHLCSHRTCGTAACLLTHATHVHQPHSHSCLKDTCAFIPIAHTLSSLQTHAHPTITLKSTCTHADKRVHIHTHHAHAHSTITLKSACTHADKHEHSCTHTYMCALGSKGCHCPGATTASGWGPCRRTALLLASTNADPTAFGA